MQPYGNFFPATYQNPYSQNFQQNGFGNQMPIPPLQAQNNHPPVNSMGGFIPVQDENEARMYPILPGTSATFINENAPYCYTKTLGASQLDRPTFKRFRLVEEIDNPHDAPERSQNDVQNGSIDLSTYALKADLNALTARLDALQNRIEDRNTKEDTGA